MSSTGMPFSYQGYSGLDQTGQQQEGNLQARQKLIQGLMQPSQNSNTGWGGLANAGSAIAGAMAQRSLNGQQQQIGLNNWARSTAGNTATLPDGSQISTAIPQLPQQQSAVGSWLNNTFGGGGGS